MPILTLENIETAQVPLSPHQEPASIDPYSASLDFPHWFLLVTRCLLALHLHLSYGTASSPALCVAAGSWFLCISSLLHSAVSQPCVFLYLLQHVGRKLGFLCLHLALLPHLFLYLSILVSHVLSLHLSHLPFPHLCVFPEVPLLSETHASVSPSSCASFLRLHCCLIFPLFSLLVSLCIFLFSSCHGCHQ